MRTGATGSLPGRQKTRIQLVIPKEESRNGYCTSLRPHSAACLASRHLFLLTLHQMPSPLFFVLTHLRGRAFDSTNGSRHKLKTGSDFEKRRAHCGDMRLPPQRTSSLGGALLEEWDPRSSLINWPIPLLSP